MRTDKHTGQKPVVSHRRAIAAGDRGDVFCLSRFTADPDRILCEHGLWARAPPCDPFYQPCARHDCEQFAAYSRGDETIAQSCVAHLDRRWFGSKHSWPSLTNANDILHLTDAGAELEQTLSDAQRARMRSAYRDAGPEAVAGFRTVLEAMMDTEMQRAYTRLKESST